MTVIDSGHPTKGRVLCAEQPLRHARLRRPVARVDADVGALEELVDEERPLGLLDRRRAGRGHGAATRPEPDERDRARRTEHPEGLPSRERHHHYLYVRRRKVRLTR